MGLHKGQTNNPAGKPIGAKNKIGSELRVMISDFLENNFHRVQQDFEELTPKDRAKVYCDLLQYSLPKLQALAAQIETKRPAALIIDWSGSYDSETETVQIPVEEYQQLKEAANGVQTSVCIKDWVIKPER
jgi:hypothetical protein